MVSPPDEENCGGSIAVAGEIMLFGVRVVVDSIRKSVSLNNLSQYEHPQDSANNNNSNAEKDAAGYASADDAVHRSSSANNRERKRGVPWTEEEHKRFLIGLKKLGKGDWRGIAKNFVKSRTPTQVASHAQKYYIRRANVNRRRRRSSLFDITTDSVSAALADDQQLHLDAAPQSPAEASSQTTSNEISAMRSQISVGGGSFPAPPMVYPLLISPVVLPCPPAFDGRMENDKSLVPMEIFPVPPAAAFDLNMHSVAEPALSLNLSLSSTSSRQQQLTAFHITPKCGASIMGMA